jgi:hypothetical protein
MVSPGEGVILHSSYESHTGGRREENSQQQDYDWISCISIQQTERPSAHKQSRNCSLQQKPQVARMNLLLEQIERGSNQAQNAREQESCSDRFSCTKPSEQHQGGDSKTSPTDPGQPDSCGNEESDEEIHLPACVEKV